MSNVKVSNAEHASNEESPIIVTDLGMFTETRDLQLWNADAEMVVRTELASNFTLVIPDELNADDDRVAKVLGNTMSHFAFGVLLNAEALMVTTLLSEPKVIVDN